MSTIVCQNLVSCFDSNLTEATATLKLKVAAPPPANDQRNQKSGNWGLYQTEKYSDDKDNYYTKNSSFSKLSPKSLELCTENLGSETGVDNISDCSSIFSSSPPFSPTSGEDLITPHKTIELDDWIQKPRNTYNHRELGPCRKATNFPPPLTSSNSLQVRHHREGGRLIIEAVEAPFRNTYLQAERSDGRLKLCFFTSFDAEEPTATGEEEEDEEECGGAEEEIEEVDGEMNMEVGKDKYQRLSRCSEGSHGSKGGLCSNWKTALWVATS